MIVSDKVSLVKNVLKVLLVTRICIILPKMSAYRRDSDETKYMSFLIKDDELLKSAIV